MRRFILFIGFVALIAACNNNTTQVGNFTVSGNIKSTIESDTIVLESFIDETTTELVDSAVIGPNGTFTLEGFTAEPAFYILRLKDNKTITLIIDSAEQINLNINLNNNNPVYSVKGSPESEKIALLENTLQNTTKTIDSLGAIYQANFNSPDLVVVKANLDITFNRVYQEQYDFSVKFVSENSGSLSAIIAMSQYLAPRSPVFNMQTDYKYYKMVDSALQKKYPTNFQVIKFNKFVQTLTLAKQFNTPPPGTIGVNSLAPEIVLPTINGDTLRLSSLKGKYVLVDFWASWSNASLINNKVLNKYYWQYFRKFEVFQVSLDQDLNAWKNAVKEQKLGWYQVSDLNNWNSKAATDYVVTTLPANFLINPEGKIIAVNLFNGELETKLIELFGK